MEGGEHAEAGDLAVGEIVLATKAGETAAEEGAGEESFGARGDVGAVVDEEVDVTGGFVVFRPRVRHGGVS